MDTRSPYPVHDFLDARSAVYAACFDMLSRLPLLRRRWEANRLIYPSATSSYSSQVSVLRRDHDSGEETGWQVTLELLRTWQTETMENGSIPILVLVPSHLQVYPEIWRRAVAQFKLRPERFDTEYPNRRLVDFCRSVDLEVIDLLPEFRVAASTGRRLYYKRDPHWNRAGHELAADIVADALEKWLPEWVSDRPGRRPSGSR